MNSANPPPTNITQRRQPVKKKPRLSAPNSKSTTPNAYARRSPPRSQNPAQPTSPPRPTSTTEKEEEREKSPSRSPPRKLKRPGAGARIHPSDREAALTARQRREAEEKAALAARQQGAGGSELVAEHYNAVPERGREWRRTDSQIKGLRSLNNWVKSTLIQKFSPSHQSDGGGAPLLVLDMACGKGGDLGKWEKAPVVPGLYVGCDIADVSIEQARQRWGETLRRGRGNGRMQAEFYVHDAFSKPLGEIPRIRQVGFNPHSGPGNGVIVAGGMATMGGFDVVSMMFALHYSYESEELARGMLRNVSGALKKGGRFIGVMPNSDVVSGMVKRLLGGDGGKGMAKKTPEGRVVSPNAGGEEGEIAEAAKDEEVEEEDDWDPEKPSEPLTNGAAAAEEEEGEEWDPEKPSEQQPSTNGTTTAAPTTTDPEKNTDDWDPEKPSTTSTPPPQPAPDTNLPPLEWGNTLYTVRFPRTQPLTRRPLPPDGIFRPPTGWRYHYHLAEAVDVPEYVVPWEAFRALAEEYGLELMYRKGFREVLEDEGRAIDGDGELRRLAERMGVLRRDGGLLVGEEEMEAAGFYHAFCFYRM